MNETMELEKVNTSTFPELQGWKEKQLAIVRDNPFIEIEDNKTYELAKKSRTNLVSARTDIQNQDKLIASRLKNLRSRAGELSRELIAITLPHEGKQQLEVKIHEATKEAEKAEKERIEQERKATIQNLVNDFYALWKNNIAKLQFAQIEQVQIELNKDLEGQDVEELEEFELDWAEKTAWLRSQIEERVKFLTEQEAARVEREELAKERKVFEDLQKQAKAKTKKEEAERAKREAKEIAAWAEVEAAQKAEREDQQREIQRQRKELEAEKKRIADGEAKKQAAIEAERAEKEAIFAKEKADAEEKEGKEAEAKRMEALKPDKEKALAFIKDMVFKSDRPKKFKNKAVYDILKEFTLRAEILQEDAIEAIENLK